MKNTKLISVIVISLMVVTFLVVINHQVSKEIDAVATVEKPVARKMAVADNAPTLQNPQYSPTDIVATSDLLNPVEPAKPKVEKDQSAPQVTSPKIIYEIPLDETILLQ